MVRFSEEERVEIIKQIGNQCHTIIRGGAMSKKKGKIMLDLVARCLTSKSNVLTIPREEFYKYYKIGSDKVYYEITQALTWFQIQDNYWYKKICGSTGKDSVSEAIKILYKIKRKNNNIFIYINKRFHKNMLKIGAAVAKLMHKDLFRKDTEFKEKYSLQLYILMLSIHTQRKYFKTSLRDLEEKLQLEDNSSTRSQLAKAIKEVNLVKEKKPLIQVW
jgi:predicted CopG family antitoxin